MSISRCLCLLSALAFLNGCALTGGFAKRQDLPTAAQHELSVLGAHLDLMREMADGDFQKQEARFNELQLTDQRVGSSRTALRLALARVTTGHPNSDLGQGYEDLQRALSAPDELHPSERNLISVLLNETESAMIQAARNAELSSAIDESRSNAASRENVASRASLLRAQRQLSNARDEIRALEEELAEARAKLDAIKRIEVTSE